MSAEDIMQTEVESYVLKLFPDGVKNICYQEAAVAYRLNKLKTKRMLTAPLAIKFYALDKEQRASMFSFIRLSDEEFLDLLYLFVEADLLRRSNRRQNAGAEK
jgi:hypothetical protein